MARDNSNRIVEWYDTVSSSYDELYGEEQSLKHDRILEYFKARNFGTLIDIGCGTGTFLRKARQLYQYGLGIDISNKMLRLAKKRRTENIDLIQATLHSLPIRDRSVDCTVSISAMTPDTGLSAFVVEIARISQDNSFLAVTVLGNPEDSDFSLSFKPDRTSRISDRETLHFLRMGRAT